MTRRNLIRWSTLSAALMSRGISNGQAPVSSPRTIPFQTRLPRLPTLKPVARDATTDYYEMTLTGAKVEIVPGLPSAVWGFNGMYPGPTIVARAGRTVKVAYANRLNIQTSVHLHGGHTPAGSDGHPADLFDPGSTRQYTYPNNQSPGTLWYHDHAVGETARNVYMGLAGFYLVEDPAEAALNLPSGEFDIPIMIQDRTFHADGSLYYPAIDWRTVHSGFQGDTIVVNGAVQPYMQVAGRKYRFRFLNASNASDYSLRLERPEDASVVPLTQIGIDGGLLPVPVARATLSLSPGERADIVVDFAQSAPGSSLVMLNASSVLHGLHQVMRFDVMDRLFDGSTVPQDLRTIEPLPPGRTAQSREIVLGIDPQRLVWVLNGKPFDPARIDFRPALGSVEDWTWINRSGMIHPMHIHNVQVQVVTRNGMPPPAWEAGWRDTVPVYPGERVRVIMQFVDYTGVFVFHCHKLEHEDHDMMGQFEVV